MLLVDLQRTVLINNPTNQAPQAVSGRHQLTYGPRTIDKPLDCLKELYDKKRKAHSEETIPNPGFGVQRFRPFYKFPPVVSGGPGHRGTISSGGSVCPD